MSDENGRFGSFGGRFVSETLMPLILSLESEYEKAKIDKSFWKEMDFSKDYVEDQAHYIFQSV